MAKIRVLQACNQLGIGGTEKTIQIFSKYLNRDRFEVFVCGLRAGGTRVEELARLGVTAIVQPPDLDRLIRDLRIDVYHIYRAGDHEPGTLPSKHGGWPKIVETNVFDAIDPLGHPLIDAHVFFSEWCRTDYLGAYGRFHGKRYEVLYGPIDFDEFPRAPREFSWTIGRCSRPDDQKWHPVCIDILPKVWRKAPQMRCRFRGWTPRVRAHLRRLGIEDRVEFSEPVLGVAEFYRGLDIYTHGARIGEGYGVVLAEAMASGLPVVTIATPQKKKCNAQAEVVDHNETGFVVRYAWQYADAVIELLQNQAIRERFGQRGYEKARDHFEASKLTRKLEQLYTDLMDAERTQ
jgi:glycosyltransferase involved in cell wall biosynthesis